MNCPPNTHTHTHTHTLLSAPHQHTHTLLSPDWGVEGCGQHGSGWFRKVFFFFLHSWILSLVGREFWGGEGEFACKSPGPGVG